MKRIPISLWSAVLLVSLMESQALAANECPPSSSSSSSESSSNTTVQPYTIEMAKVNHSADPLVQLPNDPDGRSSITMYTEFETPSGVAASLDEQCKTFLAALPATSGHATLKSSPSGQFFLNDGASNKDAPVVSSGPQVFAKPTTIKKVLGPDGKRSVVIGTDHGDTVIEWPPIDDPVFVDNPFRNPKIFVPNESEVGKPDERKTVVAYWDRAWKNFQLLQGYLQQLLNKRERLLAGLTSAGETGNDRQTTAFGFELFDLDQKITGVTGSLNNTSDFLNKFGKLKDKS